MFSRLSCSLDASLLKIPFILLSTNLLHLLVKSPVLVAQSKNNQRFRLPTYNPHTMTTTNNKPGHSFKKPCCSGTDDRAKPWTRLSETQFFKFPIDEYHTDGATTSEIVCDIDNAVHAMFTRDKFPCADYAALLPAL